MDVVILGQRLSACLRYFRSTTRSGEGGPPGTRVGTEGNQSDSCPGKFGSTSKRNEENITMFIMIVLYTLARNLQEELENREYYSVKLIIGAGSLGL
jgi:hypothetical protein